MKRIVRITPHFAVTGALEPADFEAAAALGFRSIVSNLPDGELPAYPASGRDGASWQPTPVSASGTSPSPRPRHSPSASSAAR